MAQLTWGMLEKSMFDPEKIEEAIARIVNEHNENEEAHLAEGQSLQSHKASEIIDHAVNSIVADKIKEGQVDISKLLSMLSSIGDIGVISDFSEFNEYLVGSGTVEKWIRRCKLKTGSTINSIASAYRKFCFSPGFSGSFRFDFRVYFDEEFNEGAEAYIKIASSNYLPDTGDSDDKCFGFKIEMIDEEELIYKVTGFVRRYDSLSTLVISEAIVATESHTLSIVKNAGVDYFYFYLDDVLIGSILKTGMAPYSTDEYIVHAIKNIAANSNWNWLISIGHKLWDY